MAGRAEAISVTPEIALVWPELKESASYPPAAYGFVQEGLRRTCDRLVEHERDTLGMSRHVTGQELCIGLRDHAVERFGMLARTVLESWGVCRTEDFGRIVFAMVDAGLLRTTDEDSLDDFTGVFEFDEAFDSRVNA
jgi:uncharacterized repeat protein (TIGR04138 family)